MANLGDWGTFLLGMMPLINILVALIEKLFVGATGAEKKAAAMDFISAVAPSVSAPSEVVTGVLSAAIDGHVAVLNAAGVFAHNGSGSGGVSTSV